MWIYRVKRGNKRFMCGTVSKPKLPFVGGYKVGKWPIMVVKKE